MPFDGYSGQFGDVARLIDARSRIADPSRWVKGTFKDGDRRCILGALSDACESLSVKHPNDTERRLTRIVAKQLPWRHWSLGQIGYRPARWSLMAFNDRPRTSHADALSLFDRAITRLTNEQVASAESELLVR